MEKRNNIKAVLMDFDGTLVYLPTNYNRMRKRLREFFEPLEIQSDFQPIMESLTYSLLQLKTKAPDRSLDVIKKEAYNIIENEEMEAIGGVELIEGATDIIEWLQERGIKVIIITRNGSKCVKEAFKKLKIPTPDFLASRDDVDKVKPEKEHAEFVLKRFGLEPEKCIVVGDSCHDFELGKRTGIPVVLVDYSDSVKDIPRGKDTYVITSLSGLKELIEGVRC